LKIKKIKKPPLFFIATILISVVYRDKVKKDLLDELPRLKMVNIMLIQIKADDEYISILVKMVPPHHI